MTNASEDKSSKLVVEREITRGNSRQAVLVAGMHRSGTSAATRVLSILGCGLPRDLVPPSRNDNDRGFWEAKPIVELDNEMLASTGSYWDDWNQIRPEWFGSPAAEQFVTQAGELIHSAFNDAPVIVLKDPRICRLLPIWIKAVQLAGYAPSVVMPVRSPLEVVQSLQKRSQIDTSIGYLIWLRHVLDAEFHSRDYARTVVLYQTLMTDWQAWARKVERDLSITFPRLSVVAEDEVSEFIEPSLWRSRAPDSLFRDNAQVPDWVKEAYQILQVWGAGSLSAKDQSKLDRIRTEFQKSASVYVRPMYAYRKARIEVGALTAEVQVHQRQSKESADKLSKFELVRGALASEIVKLKADHEVALRGVKDAAAAELKKELEARGAEVARLQADHEVALRGVKDAAATELGNEREAYVALESRSLTLAVQVDEAGKRILFLSDAKTALKASLDETLAALEAESTKSFAERQGRLAAERRQDELCKQIALVEEHLASLSSREAEARSVVASLRGELLRKQEMHANEVAVRFGEIAELTRLLSQRERVISTMRQVLVGLVKSFSLVPIDQSIRSWVRPSERRQSELKRFRAMLVEAKGIDPDWYGARNQDVASEGIDPVMHFILHGVFEGRAPLPEFVED